MKSSIKPRAARALVGAAIAWLLTGCAPEVTGEPASGPRSSPTVTSGTTENIRLKLGKHQVLSKKVSLREPLTLLVQDNALVLTFAQRGHDGTTLSIDPITLFERTSTPMVFAERQRPHQPPPHTSREPVSLTLDRGWSLLCYTDIETNRVMAQARDPRGESVGKAIMVSRRSMDVVGPPKAVIVDGQNVVVAFFETTEDGFELVAARLNTSIVTL